MSMLDRNNPDLLFIVLNFLKKLSIFGDNKTEMKERGLAAKLTRFIPCNNQLLDFSSTFLSMLKSECR